VTNVKIIKLPYQKRYHPYWCRTY